MVNTNTDNNNETLEELTPTVPKEALDHIKEVFDIRKIVMSTETVDYLRGVQAVLNYMEYMNKKDNDE